MEVITKVPLWVKDEIIVEYQELFFIKLKFEGPESMGLDWIL